MRSKYWLYLMAVLLVGTMGCAATVTTTARTHGPTSFGFGTFVRDLARDVQRSTGPVLFYGSQTNGAPQVTPNMRINFLPQQEGTDFFLNCQCEANSIRVTDNNRNVDVNDDDWSGAKFHIRNSHKGGERLVRVEVDCPGMDAPWTLEFWIQSSGPLIPRR